MLVTVIDRVAPISLCLTYHFLVTSTTALFTIPLGISMNGILGIPTYLRWHQISEKSNLPGLRSGWQDVTMLKSKDSERSARYLAYDRRRCESGDWYFAVEHKKFTRGGLFR